MKNLITKFVKCEAGATAIEYGLIAALIGVGIITVVSSAGSGINTTFSSAKKGMAKAPTF